MPIYPPEWRASMLGRFLRGMCGFLAGAILFFFALNFGASVIETSTGERLQAQGLGMIAFFLSLLLAPVGGLAGMVIALRQGTDATEAKGEHRRPQPPEPTGSRVPMRRTIGRILVALGIVLLLIGAFQPRIRNILSGVSPSEMLFDFALWTVGCVLFIVGLILPGRKR